MMLYEETPIANGLRTDHPIPGLPFVDDSHIPIDDPVAIEAIGRRGGGETWGREDKCRIGGGWAAFTTDPGNHDAAWGVRWHPDHGRSVMVFRDGYWPHAHQRFVYDVQRALLLRSGGYWWDGTFWYRPAQVWDRVEEQYVERIVPGAQTVTAADVLAAGDGDPGRARVLAVSEVTAGSGIPAGEWVHHLAMWARDRGPARLASEAVVTLFAPELGSDQLVSMSELAAFGGIAPSTLRSYMSRGQSEVPAPQVEVAGRKLWSRAVAEEWAEQRRRGDPGGLEMPIALGDKPRRAAPGIEALQEKFAGIFRAVLLDAGYRKGWLGKRLRNVPAGLDQRLAWEVAEGLRGIVPLHDLGLTIQAAILKDFADNNGDRQWLVISPATGRMLDWFVRHDPNHASAVIGETALDAVHSLGLAREDVEQAFHRSLSLDSKLPNDERKVFLDRTFGTERREV